MTVLTCYACIYKPHCSCIGFVNNEKKKTSFLHVGQEEMECFPSLQDFTPILDSNEQNIICLWSLISFPFQLHTYYPNSSILHCKPDVLQELELTHSVATFVQFTISANLTKYSNELQNWKTLLGNNDKCNYNWSLWGASHIGQAKVIDCNHIQGHDVIAVFQ